MALLTDPAGGWRRLAVGLLGIVLLLLGLGTAVWLFACKRLDDDVRAAIAAGQAEGWTLRAGPPTWAGWPAAAEVWFQAVTIRGSPSVFPPGLAWSSERVRLRVSLAHPTMLAIIAEGKQTIAAEGVPAIPFSAERGQATVDLNGREPTRMSAGGLDAALPSGTLRIGAAELQFPPDGLAADLTDIVVPAGEHPPAIGEVRLLAHATRPFPFAPTPADSARAWRAAGGRIEVSTASLHWGPLTASGRATIGLDEQLQPDADGTIEAAGLPELLDALVAAKALGRSPAVAAKAVLAILSAPAGGGPVPLPLAFHEGVLSVARFPLLRLAPLVWR